MDALGNLTDYGKDNGIFTGDQSKQVDSRDWSVHGHTFKVYDYFTAVQALQDIVEQGEGSSACNPVVWNNGKREDLSHYFLFYSIAEKHEIQVFQSAPPLDDNDADEDSAVDYTKVQNRTLILYKNISCFVLFLCF